MNIQIFGTAKSFDTKKAQRWFKERGIRFQMIDLAVKGMSRGEFESVCRAVGGWEEPCSTRIPRTNRTRCSFAMHPRKCAPICFWKTPNA